MIGTEGEGQNAPQDGGVAGSFPSSRVRMAAPGMHFSSGPSQQQERSVADSKRDELNVARPAGSRFSAPVASASAGDLPEPPRPSGKRFAASPLSAQGTQNASVSSRGGSPLPAADETAVFLAMAAQRDAGRKTAPSAETTARVSNAPVQQGGALQDGAPLGTAAQGGAPLGTAAQESSPWVAAPQGGASQGGSQHGSSDFGETAALWNPSSLNARVDTQTTGFQPIIPAPAAASQPRAASPSGHSGAQPPQPKKGGRVAATLLIVVGVVLLAVAGFLFVRAQLGYKEARDAYGKIQNSALQDVQSELGDNVPNVDFDALAAVSKDIVGWIYIPNTQVNYPVVQGKSNEQYLRHLPDGTYNMNGSIFMDVMDTAPGMIDQQTTLYGHHMNDDSMFRVIDKTLDQSVFNEIKHVYYITPDVTYVLTPMFTAQVQDTFVDARRSMFEDDAAFHKYLDDLLAQAKAKAPDAAERADKADNVLTLITCAGEIIPRTTRAAMVLSIDEMVARK